MISKVDFEPCRAVMALNFLLISNLEDGKYKSHGYTALTPEIPSPDFWKFPIMYDIIYRQIKMVDGHSLGGLRVRTRSQNSSVTDHGF